MVFGKGVWSQRENIEHIEVDNIEHIEVDEDENSIEDNTFINDIQEVNTREVKDDKPLLQEVNIISVAINKNARGAKKWVCKHCKQQFTSSYTRIHAEADLEYYKGMQMNTLG